MAINFGALQIAVLWRMEKAGVVREAVVVDSPQGPRLVIVEADQIVRWERFVLTGELRKRAVELREDLRKTGWREGSRADLPPARDATADAPKPWTRPSD